jgi:hypothetical protein
MHGFLMQPGGRFIMQIGGLFDANRHYRPDLPILLENVLLKAIACNPEERLETADAFLLTPGRGASRPRLTPASTRILNRDPAIMWHDCHQRHSLEFTVAGCLDSALTYFTKSKTVDSAAHYHQASFSTTCVKTCYVRLITFHWLTL